MALRDLIALDDLVAVDRADARHDLLIFDALARRLVDLVELDLRAALGRRIDLHRDRHQGEPDLPSPNWTRSHRLLLRSDSINAAPSRFRSRDEIVQVAG